MGCANTKAGATAYGAPEEAPAEGGEGSKAEVPKVVVDGEAQQQSAEMALNGSVVQNGADGEGTEGSQEKCNGGVNGDAKGADENCKSSGEEDEQKTGDSTAPSGEGESNENINGTTVDGGSGGNDESEIKGASDEDGKDSGAGEGVVPSESGNDAAAESRESSSQDGDGDNAE